MKVTREEMEHRQVSLQIEIEDGELDKALDEAYHALVNKVSIPGFRKGKAPRNVLEQHTGKDALLDRALERLIPQLYERAIESEKIEPIGQPQIEVVQEAPVVFKAMVPLKPEIKLGDYHSLKLEPEPVEIGDAEIGTAIEQVQQKQGVWVPVDRPVQLGDLVTIDVEASVEETPFLNHKDLAYEVNKDSSLPLPGFAQNLEGAEKNKESIFTLIVPASYKVKEFADKDCLFKVVVTEVKEGQLPELDDEFAKKCNYDSLSSMREQMGVDMRIKAEEQSWLMLKQKAIDAVVEISQVEYPPILEEWEIDGMLEDEARRFGYKEVQDFLRTANKTVEDLREKLRLMAKPRVVHSLVLGKIAEEEKIEITSSEIDNKVEDMIKESNDKEKLQQFFALPHVRNSVEQSLHTQKTIDRLVEIVTCGKDETVD